MRTTLTLDDDVAVKLDRLRESRRTSLKALVNDALRLGLRNLEEPAKKPKEPFRIKAVSLGRCRLPNLDNIGEVLAIGEGEDYK